MKNVIQERYAIDNASILFLAQMRKDHTNSFRFSMTLTDPICPVTLQKAVDQVYHRFPTVIAGFRSGFFGYFQIPAKNPPKVQKDPGCLITMTKEELKECAYRVYYSGNTIAIEAFHALTDGYGAIASFTTLVAEYLHLMHHITIPISYTLLDITMPPEPQELEDSFLTYEQQTSDRLPSRYAYQLPGRQEPRKSIKKTTYTVPSQKLLDAAHQYGVSANTLLSAVMADTIMEIQKNKKTGKLQPVRIMVPVNLRKLFPSSTLRNFSYYVLPTMEPEEAGKPLCDLVNSFGQQIRAQMAKEQMAALITNNVKLQKNPLFCVIPLVLKRSLMRIICRFFGETNSSVTVTNLGNVVLPEEMKAYVEHMDVTLTPRMLSPYGCAILSYNGLLTINISRFTAEAELDSVFFRKLDSILNNEA